MSEISPILLQCRDAVQTLNALNSQLQRCRKTGDDALVYNSLCTRRDELIITADHLRAAAQEKILHIRDVRQAAILMGYYMLGQTDREIGELQGLSREQVNHLRLQAARSL